MVELINNPLIFFIYLGSILIVIAVHEYAHAWMANHLGDPTAQIKGRLTLDPRAHIDPLGLFFLLFFGFGWGKPVPFDPFNLKNPRKDAGLIALAGPLSNFVFSLILSLSLRLFNLFNIKILLTIGYLFFVPLININLVLGIFNFVPIAPLDGFKIIGALIPENKSHEWYALERYGIIFLILLFFPLGGGSLVNTLITPVLNFFQNLLIPSYAKII